MGKERRLRLKFHSILPTTQARRSARNINDPAPYYYSNYKLSTSHEKTPAAKRQTGKIDKKESIKSKAKNIFKGLCIEFEDLLKNLPQQVRTIEFFDFAGKPIQNFFQVEINNDKTVDLLQKKASRRNSMLNKFDAVSQGRKSSKTAANKPIEDKVVHNIVPLLVSMPSLKVMNKPKAAVTRPSIEKAKRRKTCDATKGLKREWSQLKNKGEINFRSIIPPADGLVQLNNLTSEKLISEKTGNCPACSGDNAPKDPTTKKLEVTPSLFNFAGPADENNACKF